MLRDLVQRVKALEDTPVEENKDNKEGKEEEDKEKEGKKKAGKEFLEAEWQENLESQKQKKGSPCWTTFPAAMLKFTSVHRKKQAEIDKSKLNASLEGPYGMGCLVFPALQRFNNIHFFLALYCTLVLSQGKPEEQ